MTDETSWKATPPATISIAAVLILVVAAIDLALIARSLLGEEPGAIHPLVYMSESIIVLVYVGAAILVLLGRGWPRWLLLPIIVARLFMYGNLLLNMASGAAPLFVVTWVLQPVCLIAALLLLFGPGRAWFKRGNS